MEDISVMLCDDSALMRNLIGRIIAVYDGFEIVEINILQFYRYINYRKFFIL